MCESLVQTLLGARRRRGGSVKVLQIALADLDGPGLGEQSHSELTPGGSANDLFGCSIVHRRRLMAQTEYVLTTVGKYG